MIRCRRFRFKRENVFTVWNSEAQCIRGGTLVRSRRVDIITRVPAPKRRFIFIYFFFLRFFRCVIGNHCAIYGFLPRQYRFEMVVVVDGSVRCERKKRRLASDTANAGKKKKKKKRKREKEKKKTDEISLQFKRFPLTVS